METKAGKGFKVSQINNLGSFDQFPLVLNQ